MILTSVCISAPRFFVLSLCLFLSSALTVGKSLTDDSEPGQLSDAWTGNDEVLLTSYISSLSSEDACQTSCY